MILIGASGHCKVIADILGNCNISVSKIYDTNNRTFEVCNVTVSNLNEKEISAETEAIICIGNNQIRKTIANQYCLNYGLAIHPHCSISEFSEIGSGSVVMANAVINAGSSIGKHCIVNSGAIVEHDCTLEDFVHISPNAALAGNVSVGEGSHIGIGAIVIQGINIGRWVTIGAGAVIIRDVPDFATVVGNPGKVIKVNPRC